MSLSAILTQSDDIEDKKILFWTNNSTVNEAGNIIILAKCLCYYVIDRTCNIKVNRTLTGCISMILTGLTGFYTLIPVI